MSQADQTDSNLMSAVPSIPMRVLVPVVVAVFCLVFVVSSDRGLSIAIRDPAVNDLGYLERPTSVIEKNDRLYGWAIAIEREEIDSVRVHFEMWDTEQQNLSGIGRPTSIAAGNDPAPLDAMAGLQALVEEHRTAAEADAVTMPVVELGFDDGSVVFASPQVLMRHCPDVDATADVHRVEGLYVILEAC